MMKNVLKLSNLVVVFTLWSTVSLAQTINHPYNTGVTTNIVVGAGGYTYYDSGGPGGNYFSNHTSANTFVTFAPQSSFGKIQATFTQFDLEGSFDALYVWNGPTSASPKIASGNGAPVANAFWGTGGWWGVQRPFNIAPNIVQSSAPGGELTFGFVSDASVQNTGWTALITQVLSICDPVAGPNQVLNSALGTCLVSATVPIPTFSPSGCGNDPEVLLRYRVNDDTFINVSKPYPANLTMNLYPGVYSILWQTTDLNDVVRGESTQTITVNEFNYIQVSGNGIVIANGSTSPSATNHTKFGSVALNGTSTRTFTIQNVGYNDLILTGTPIVEIVGADPSYFTVTMQPSLTEIESCDEITFSIQYNGSAYGLHTATVSIANNSYDNNPYTFAISGAASQMRMQVRGNSVLIPDGDVTPAAGDFTDFGTLNYNSIRSRSFYLHNIGMGSLILSGTPRVQLSGPGADKFTVTLQPASPISGGQNKGFSIRFDATAIGDFYATVSIASNDLGANPYTFTIRGTVLPPDIYVTGNNITIENGDDSPQTADFTDFASRAVGSTTTFSYYVRNQAGGGLLFLNGLPRATISGPGAGMFLIASQPVASISPGGNSLLRISYKPTAIGTYTATITIPNNDPNKDPYTFNVRGTTPGAMPFWGVNEEMPFAIIEEGLSVYPNPATDQIFIDAPFRQENYTLEMLSIEGKVIHSIQTQGGRMELNIQSWVPGMYYIRAVGVELDPIRFIRSE
jgi:hypothetical protein